MKDTGFKGYASEFEWAFAKIRRLQKAMDESLAVIRKESPTSHSFEKVLLVHHILMNEVENERLP